LNVWATAYLVTRWTGSLLGGLVAGLLFAVSPFHQGGLFHLQRLGTFYYPLILLGLERFGGDGRCRVGCARCSGVRAAAPERAVPRVFRARRLGNRRDARARGPVCCRAAAPVGGTRCGVARRGDRARRAALRAPLRAARGGRRAAPPHRPPRPVEHARAAPLSLR